MSGAKDAKGFDMGCCGMTVAGAQANSAEMIDLQVEAGLMVRLVFICDEKRTEPYLAGGRVYQFGNNDRRRVNAVPARYVPNFLDPNGRYFGCFMEFDADLFNEDGTEK